jgi:RimJ/RimL family protein N-acetyltransferase
MQTHSTTRLVLNELSTQDAVFIMELVNTPEWIEFIGDRHITNVDDATDYIQKIIDNPHVQYWVVRLRDLLTPIGIITLIKRDYLTHPDIGFAFLPQYTQQGYAYEASAALLHDITTTGTLTQVLAITVKENTHSIRLLEKLGLHLQQKIEKDNEVLLVYGMGA